MLSEHPTEPLKVITFQSQPKRHEPPRNYSNNYVAVFLSYSNYAPFRNKKQGGDYPLFSRDLLLAGAATIGLSLQCPSYLVLHDSCQVRETLLSRSLEHLSSLGAWVVDTLPHNQLSSSLLCPLWAST